MKQLSSEERRRAIWRFVKENPFLPPTAMARILGVSRQRIYQLFDSEGIDRPVLRRKRERALASSVAQR